MPSLHVGELNTHAVVDEQDPKDTSRAWDMDAWAATSFIDGLSLLILHHVTTADRVP